MDDRKPIEELIPPHRADLYRNPEHDAGRELQVKMRAAEALIEQLRAVAGEDDDFLADLIEGQTDVFDILERIAQAEFDDQILLTGIKDAQAKLAERKRRTEARIETARSLVAATLYHLGLKKHRFGIGTYSVSPKPLTAIVTDEALIHSMFWKPQPPALDKKALNEAVVGRAKALEVAAAIEDQEARQAALAKAAEDYPEIPGTTISNGGLVVTVRR